MKATDAARERIRVLLDVTRQDQGAFAMWCGRSQSWVSKILSGKRNLTLHDIDRAADFFGLSASQLLTPPHDPLMYPDRRTNPDRRHGAKDRREGRERRKKPVIQ